MFELIFNELVKVTYIKRNYNLLNVFLILNWLKKKSDKTIQMSLLN